MYIHAAFVHSWSNLLIFYGPWKEPGREFSPMNSSLVEAKRAFPQWLMVKKVASEQECLNFLSEFYESDQVNGYELERFASEVHDTLSRVGLELVKLSPPQFNETSYCIVNKNKSDMVKNTAGLSTDQVECFKNIVRHGMDYCLYARLKRLQRSLREEP